jgi:hypothetical protein
MKQDMRGEDRMYKSRPRRWLDGGEPGEQSVIHEAPQQGDTAGKRVRAGHSRAESKGYFHGVTVAKPG